MRILLLISLLVLPSAYAQEKRIALLIGNEDYPADVGRLTLPHQDVEILAAALNDVGFSVTSELDLDEDEMHDVLSHFERDIDHAAEQGAIVVAFLYYSGHGASALVGGERVNYLLPAREQITTASQLARKGISLDDIIHALSATRAQSVFVVADACRNDLVSGFYKSGQKGFAPSMAKSGMFISHSTYPGAVAPDDGAFAQALARYIRLPGLEAARVFQLSNREVALGRGVTQIPTTANALTRDFYFSGAVDQSSDNIAHTDTVHPSDEVMALAEAMSADTITAYTHFKMLYPTSKNIAFIDTRIEALQPKESLPQSSASSRTSSGSWSAIAANPIWGIMKDKVSFAGVAGYDSASSASSAAIAECELAREGRGEPCQIFVDPYQEGCASFAFKGPSGFLTTYPGSTGSGFGPSSAVARTEAQRLCGSGCKEYLNICASEVLRKESKTAWQAN